MEQVLTLNDQWSVISDYVSRYFKWVNITHICLIIEQTFANFDF